MLPEGREDLGREMLRMMREAPEMWSSRRHCRYSSHDCVLVTAGRTVNTGFTPRGLRMSAEGRGKEFDVSDKHACTHARLLAISKARHW